MKNKRNNDALMEAFAHVQAAARIMGKLDERLSSEPLLSQSTANDELDFEELQNIADGLYDKLCRMAPKFRLLIYSGAPNGTICKKTRPPEELTSIALAQEILAKK